MCVSVRESVSVSERERERKRGVGFQKTQEKDKNGKVSRLELKSGPQKGQNTPKACPLFSESSEPCI